MIGLCNPLTLWFPKRVNPPHNWCAEKCDGCKRLAFVRVHGSDCWLVCLEVLLAWPIRPPAIQCCSLQISDRRIHNAVTPCFVSSRSCLIYPCLLHYTPPFSPSQPSAHGSRIAVGLVGRMMFQANKSGHISVSTFLLFFLL